MEENKFKYYFNEGVKKYDAKDFKGAIEDYTKAIEFDPNLLDPNLVAAFNNRGLAKFQLKKYTGAIEDYTKVIELNPNLLNPNLFVAFKNRGLAKFVLKKYTKAIEDYNKAIELNSNDTEIYFNRGLAKVKLEKYIEAIKDYTKAIELNPDYFEAFINRGNAQNELQNYTEALKDFDRAIELNPNFFEAFNNRGIAKLELQKYTEALNDFNKAIELNPNYTESYNNRGLLKLELQKYTEALNDFNKAIGLNPNNTELYNNRGLAKFELQKYTEGLKDYNKAIELNPNNSKVYFNRSVLKIKLNKNIEAKEDYYQAFKTCFENKKNIQTNKRILKFRSINNQTKQSIKNNEIWFAHPSTFNDPLDGNFLQNFFYNQYELKLVLNSILVASLVQEQTNQAINNEHLMWAHYSKNHTGICLVYEFVQNEIENNEYFIDKIHYTDKLKRPTVNKLDNTIKDGFFTKYKIWDYENEIRILYLLKENKNSDGIAIPLNKLGLQLKEIIFGLKCTEKDKKTFCEIIKNKPELNVAFFEMKEQNPAIEIDNHFLIDKVPYNLTPIM